MTGEMEHLMTIKPDDTAVLTDG